MYYICNPNFWFLSIQLKCPETFPFSPRLHALIRPKFGRGIVEVDCKINGYPITYTIQCARNLGGNGKTRRFEKFRTQSDSSIGGESEMFPKMIRNLPSNAENDGDIPSRDFRSQKIRTRNYIAISPIFEESDRQIVSQIVQHGK